MSKYVKDLLCQELQRRLAGVEDALLVSVAGMPATANNRLRNELASKDIRLLVVKNSLARRAMGDTPLGRLFASIEGPAAVAWGSSDIVSLAKEIARLQENKEYQPFQARGGVMDGQPLSPEEVKAVSTWPSREEQLAILAGQILSVGGMLAGQIAGVGGTLAGQIAQRAEEEAEEGADGAASGGEPAA